MRKKLFAIVMSMTMVASFMPSLAFAATEHNLYGLDDGCAWKLVQDQIDAENSNVEVVKKATHTEKGVVKVKCGTPMCDEVVTIETATVPHQDLKDCAHKDFGIDELAELMVAHKGLPGVIKDKDFANEKAATAWVKKTKADPKGYCYMKDVKVCSCGVVREYGKWQYHKNEKCTDEVCADCGRTVKATAKHTWVNDDPAVVVEADCGNGVGHKATCSECGAKGVNYDGDNNVSKTATHKFGTVEKATDATEKVKDGTDIVTTVKVGYVAVSNASVDYKADTTVLVPGEPVADTKDYDFFKYNTVVKEPTCEDAGIGTLTCTVCGKNLKDDDAKDVEISIARAGHDWEETEVAATCDSNAYTHKVCKVCKDVSDVEKANTKLAHNYKVTMTNATCKGGEVYTIECTTCKDCAHDPVELTKADFDPADLYAEDADTVTYLWKGFADNQLSTKDAIHLTFSKKPVAHKYGKKELLRAADCENNEVWGYKCTECGKIAIHVAGTYGLDEKLNTALGHDHPVVSVAATCVNKAYEAKAEKCTRCGKEDAEIVKANEKAATAAKIAGGKHAFDKWVVTKASTVFEEGVKTLTCSACGAHDDTKTVIAKAKYAAPAVKAGKKSATVTVKATAGAVSYKISYKKAGGSYKTIAAKAGKKTIKKLAKGKKYTFKAIAVNAEGVKVASATKTVKVK